MASQTHQTRTRSPGKWTLTNRGRVLSESHRGGLNEKRRLGIRGDSPLEIGFNRCIAFKATGGPGRPASTLSERAIMAVYIRSPQAHGWTVQFGQWALG